MSLMACGSPGASQRPAFRAATIWQPICVTVGVVVVVAVVDVVVVDVVEVVVEVAALIWLQVQILVEPSLPLTVHLF